MSKSQKFTITISQFQFQKKKKKKILRVGLIQFVSNGQC